MKIWVDLTNAPHFHLFKNFIKKYNPIVTARKQRTLINLLEEHDIDYIEVGVHEKDKKKKLLASLERAKELVEIAEECDIGIAKHSVELPRVCFGLGIKSIFIVDNEHAEHQNRLTLPLADKVVAPEFISKEKLAEQGARSVEYFFGLCEVEHVKNFRPNQDLLDKFNLEAENYVVVRQPPVYASYFSSRDFSLELVNRLKEHVKVVFIPRGDVKIFDENVVVVKFSDTLSLTFFSKAFIGGGGTMNREACMLAKPTISFYPQELLGVDKFLVNAGILKWTTDIHEIIDFVLNLDEDYSKIIRKKLEKLKLISPIDVVEKLLSEWNTSES